MMNTIVEEAKKRVEETIRKACEKTIRPANAEVVKNAVCQRLDELEASGNLARMAEHGQHIERNVDGSWPVYIQHDEVVLHSTWDLPHPITYILTPMAFDDDAEV